MLEYIKEWLESLDEIVYAFIDFIAHIFNIEHDKESSGHYVETRFFVKPIVRIFAILMFIGIEVALVTSLMIMIIGRPVLAFTIIYISFAVTLVCYNYDSVRELILGMIESKVK